MAAKKNDGGGPDGILIKVKADVLVRAVDAIVNIPERKPSVPILEHALMTVKEDGRASLLMTDQEILGEAFFDASTSAAWSGVLPSEIIAWARARPEGEIGLTVDPDSMTMKAQQGRARMTIAILTADDFPRLDPPAQDFNFVLPAGEFTDALTRTVGAVEQPGGRIYLEGVNIRYAASGDPASDEPDGEELKGGARLVFTATDGHRVHRECIPAPDGTEEMAGFIVPTKAVNAIVKAFNGMAGDVVVTGEKNRISVGSETVTIITKMIDADYPDIDRIIPEPGEVSARVDAKTFAQSLARMRALKDDGAKSGGRGMRIELKDGTVSMSIRRKGTADAIEDEIAGEGEGEWFNGIDPALLQTALAQAGVKEVTLAPGNQKQPAIRLETGTPDRLFLIMCRSVF